MATSLTQADLDRLEAALAKGVRTVSYGGNTVTFGSVQELKEAISYVKAQLDTSGGSMTSFASFARC